MEEITSQNNFAGRKLYLYLGSLLAITSFILASLAISFEAIPHAWINNFGEIFGLLVVAIILIAPVIITMRAIKRGKQDLLNDVNITILRYALFMLMLMYATAKLLFGQLHVFYSALDSRLNDVNDMFLVWYFYGRSNAFQLIIGLMELIPALLFLTRRTTFLAAAITLPVIINIFMLNFFYRIGGTILISFLMTFFDVYVLYSYKKEIKDFLQRLRNAAVPFTQKPSGKRARLIIKTAFLLFIVLFYGFALMMRYKNRKEAPFAGGYELTQFSLNNASICPDSAGAGFYYRMYFEKGKQASKMKDKNNEEKRILVRFYARDSIRLSENLGTYDNSDFDPSASFYGIYKLAGKDELTLKGVQNGNRIEARYKKIPLKEFDSWW